MVHQHFRLVPPFTVAENVILGEHREEARRFFLQPRTIESRVATLGERYGMAINPRARIWQLSVGEQQRVEILKALYREARILILDEPTAVLTPQESDALFVTLRTMADEGRTVIFISHKLHEVKAVSDRVTVLRGGRTVATLATADASPQRARRADGRPRRRAGEAGRALEAAAGGRWRSTSTASRCAATAARRRCGTSSLSVREGEIVGVAGVAGNGQRELAEAITGMRRPRAEASSTSASASSAAATRARRSRAGVAHVPEDRLGTGVAPSLSIAENTVLKSYRGRGVSVGPILNWRAIREQARDLIKRYGVATPGSQTCARATSPAATCRSSSSGASSRASRRC